MGAASRDHGAGVGEAAAFLALHRVTVYRLIVQGKLRRYGKSRRVSCASLGAYTGSKEPPEVILAQVQEAAKSPAPNPEN